MSNVASENGASSLILHEVLVPSLSSMVSFCVEVDELRARLPRLDLRVVGRLAEDFSRGRTIELICVSRFLSCHDGGRITYRFQEKSFFYHSPSCLPAIDSE